jgi:hypothetical protein
VHSGDTSVCVAERVIQVTPALQRCESLPVVFPGLAEVELVPDTRVAAVSVRLFDTGRGLTKITVNLPQDGT